GNDGAERGRVGRPTLEHDRGRRLATACRSPCREEPRELAEEIDLRAGLVARADVQVGARPRGGATVPDVAKRLAHLEALATGYHRGRLEVGHVDRSAGARAHRDVVPPARGVAYGGDSASDRREHRPPPRSEDVLCTVRSSAG